jgi:hypothetical protein
METILSTEVINFLIFMLGFLFVLACFFVFESKYYKSTQHRLETALFPDRDSIRLYLRSNNLTFNELNSRMNYGLIGHLVNGEDVKVLLFQETFYVTDGNFAISSEHLKLIRSLQKEFKHLTRNDKGEIITFNN